MSKSNVKIENLNPGNTETYILVGNDLHSENMLLKIGINKQEPIQKIYKTDFSAVDKMIKFLKNLSLRHVGAKTVVAYEASGEGYWLRDYLEVHGIECAIVPPTHLSRSRKKRKHKTDEKDALQLLEILRGHYLGGNKLPRIWVPDPGIREDREVVRLREEMTNKQKIVKTQIKSLLKHNCIRKPKDIGKNWTVRYLFWVNSLLQNEKVPEGIRMSLAYLLAELDFYKRQINHIDNEIVKLSQKKRYKKAVKALMRLDGVGLLTAMTFLVEVGDATRFSNRRKFGSFLGLVPSSDESGEVTDRKGHITKMGSPRLRRILCQAAWHRVRLDDDEREWFENVKRKNEKHKKIAIVGATRRLGIVMWHVVADIQKQDGIMGSEEAVAELAQSA